LGPLGVRIARTRRRTVFPAGLARLPRRAPEVTWLIRAAVLRGISPRPVGRRIALLTEEPVRAQTVSQVTRALEQAVAPFHRAPLGDPWRYLLRDGVSRRVRRPGGRKRVQRLVAYGIRPNGTRPRLACTRSQGERQGAWESLRQDLYRRGLQGDPLHLIVTEGWVGLASALQTVYPRVAHQRGWVHKLRNRLAPVRRRDHAAVKVALQAIYQATHRREAEAAARQCARQWQATYPKVVASLLKDRPELLACFSCPRRLWRRLRTTTIMERCVVAVRRRTRPMVCFVNMQSVERIINQSMKYLTFDWRW
jgi:transposase-like protein